MKSKSVIKCFNEDIHRRSDGEGHILCFIGSDNSIYIHCSDRACKRWTRLQISLPGIDLDFSKAAIVQSLMPEGYHFDAKKAAVVIGDTNDRDT